MIVPPDNGESSPIPYQNAGELFKGKTKLYEECTDGGNCFYNNCPATPPPPEPPHYYNYVEELVGQCIPPDWSGPKIDGYYQSIGWPIDGRNSAEKGETIYGKCKSGGN